MFDWLKEKGLAQGIFWATMIYLVSALNDVLSRLLGERLHFVEISFFRFLFSTVVVLYFVLKSKGALLKTEMKLMHFMRGLLGAIALGLCCLSVNIMPLAENTTILFSEALFMLPLAYIFLGEKISKRVIFSTCLGFAGLIIMFRPSAEHINVLAFVPTIAALLFAIMNIMIKKMIDNKENTWTMLFYFGLYTTLISAFIVPFYWTTPNARELALIFMLGIGANLIQLCLFMAYRATTASSISPVRYVELPFAMLFGFLFFGQIPEKVAMIGAALIIIGTFITSRKNNQNS